MTDDSRTQFLRWYDDHIDRLFNYIAYRVQEKHLAEDLTASACEKALRLLPTYDPARGSMNAWMFTIARDVLRKHYRRESSRPMVVPLEALPPIVSQGTLPEQQAEQADEFRQVMAHIDRLSDAQQEAIALRFGAQLSYAEIAQVMDCETSRVGVLLHRGIKTLQRAVKQVPHARQ